MRLKEIEEDSRLSLVFLCRSGLTSNKFVLFFLLLGNQGIQMNFRKHLSATFFNNEGMRLRCGMLWVVLSMVFSLGQAVAQHEDRFLTRIFNEEDGLGRNLINDLVRDAYGFVWIATDGGLTRYDGYHFKNFDHRNQEVFFEGGKVDKLYLYGDSLYLISFNHGLIRLNLTNYKLEYLFSKGISSAVADGSNELFVLCTSGQIERISAGKVEAKKYWNAETQTALAIDKRFLYVAINGLPIKVLDRNSLNEVSESSFDLPNFQQTFLQNEDGSFVFIRQRSLFIADSLLVLSRYPGFEGKHAITSVAFHPDGTIYYAGNFKRLCYYSEGIHRCNNIEGTKGFELRKLLILENGPLLIASNQGLIKVDRPKLINRPLDDQQGDADDFVRVRRNILEDSLGRVYLTGYPYIHILEKNGRVRVLNKENYSNYDAVLIRDNIYLATEGSGLKELNTTSNVFKSIPLSCLNHDKYLTALLVLNDSTLVVGAKGEVALLQLNSNTCRRIELIDKPVNIFGDMVMSIKQDSLTGNIWVGTMRGVFVYDRALSKRLAWIKKTNQNENNLGNEVVRELYVEHKSRKVWAGTDEGIYMIDADKLKVIDYLGREQGLSDLRIASMQADRSGRIWVSTFNGITCFEQDSRRYFQLNRKSGLSNREFNRHSAALLRSGELIFGGLNLYDRFDPDSIVIVDNDDQIYLTAIGVERDGVREYKYLLPSSDKEAINLYTGRESLILYFSTMNYSDNDNCTFQYRLGDNEWIDLNKAPEIHLANLKMGEFQLEVRGFDLFGRLMKGSGMVVINVKAPFYESRFFWILFVLLILILSSVIIFQLAQRAYIRDQVKQKISMDLHDELGTLLTRSLLVLNNKNIRLREKESFLKKNLQDAIYSLRGFIRSLTKKNFSSTDFLDDINEFLPNIFARSNIYPLFHAEIEGKPRVSPEIFRDLQLCIYEIASNAIKHSGAGTFRLLLNISDSSLELTATDDGKLLETDLIFNKGNGIGNIRKRVKKHGGEATFSINSIGHGLTVYIAIPIRKRSFFRRGVE
jgi:signal transduction histidine kinase/ligand-binding sensor domain-containing protein